MSAEVVTLPGRAPPGPQPPRRRPRRRDRRLRVGRRRTRRRSCSPTAASTSRGTFDVFAPLLADAGWRVVSWDHRGHGDSDHAALYCWQADVRDAARGGRLDQPPSRCRSSATPRAAACCCSSPTRCRTAFSHFVEPRRPAVKWRPTPDVAEPRAHAAARDGAHGLARPPPPRGASSRASRARSTSWPRAAARMNPRLSREWLRYLVTHRRAPATPTAGAGRSIPSMRFGGFGPWRPDWSLERLPGFPVPLLALLGTEQEAMGWGATAEDVAPYLPRRRARDRARGRRPLRPHRAARARSRTSCSTSWR